MNANLIHYFLNILKARSVKRFYTIRCINLHVRNVNTKKYVVWTFVGRLMALKLDKIETLCPAHKVFYVQTTSI